jgi:ribosomal protein S18 acetylase RimI-like enzyme
MSDAVEPKISVREVRTSDELTEAMELIRAYAQSLKPSYCIQDLSNELAQLATRYGPPLGGLLIAYIGDAAAGCCAFRPLPETDHANACEMKRLYVSPAYRSMGLGHLLVEAVMDAARVAGYSCVLLDTLSEMEAARALYEEMGFVEVAPYVQSPIPGAHHLKVDLQ